jgi:hypothetical protein
MRRCPADRYFVARPPRASGKSSDDTAAAARLWPTSADLVGLLADAGA